MPAVTPGEETQFEIKLRNEGWISANGVKVLVPDDPNYIITPLVAEIGVLPAKSSISIPATIRHRSTPGPSMRKALKQAKLQNIATAGTCELELGPCLPTIQLGVIY